MTHTKQFTSVVVILHVTLIQVVLHLDAKTVAPASLPAWMYTANAIILTLANTVN